MPVNSNLSNDTNSVIWKTIPSYEKYQASTNGEIRFIYKSKDGVVLETFPVKQRTVKGRKMVTLYKGNQYRPRSVKTIIGETFLGTQQVVHINGKKDNRLINLRLRSPINHPNGSGNCEGCKDTNDC